jgi:2-polyprenyl-3-methyl-5-hydroxy-6-metoxy-1,4-benzoquinol methylase
VLDKQWNCPLTNQVTDIELIDTIKTKDIIDSYYLQRNISINNEFNSDEIYLLKNNMLNFYFFYPFISGSSEFYETLTKKPLYSSEKNEYLFASKYIKDNYSVLDVGCGWGWFKSYIPNTNYLGIEFSQKSIEKCRENNIDVTSTLIQDMAKSNKKFDTVVSFQVLEHIEDPIGFIESMIKVTNENGLIIISVPNVDSYMSIVENNYLNLPPHHISWWSKETLLYIRDKFDLELIDIEIEKQKDFSYTFIVYWKNKFNKFFGRKKKFIRNGKFDRRINKFFRLLSKLMPTPEHEILPNGHSITVVFRKKN